MKNNTHYNYDLQAWIEDGKVAACGHGEKMDGCAACYLEGVAEAEAVKTHANS